MRLAVDEELMAIAVGHEKDRNAVEVIKPNRL